jgi:hypothetical protein
MDAQVTRLGRGVGHGFWTGLDTRAVAAQSSAAGWFAGAKRLSLAKPACSCNAGYTIARSAINSAIRTTQESAESAAMTSSARPRGRRPSASVVSLGL